MTVHTDPLAPYRSRLFGLAYRMLGSRADAEDVLQDAYLRFHDAHAVENAEALLMTIVTRLCLDRLKRAQLKRETYIGPWLPEPIVVSDAMSPQAATELADDLSFALLLTLEKLTPAERGAFLLHDVFDMPSEEVAAILGKSAAACRQLATRARKSVRAARPQAPASSNAHTQLFTAFMNALASGDVTALATLLREDAVMLSDSGGLKPAVRKPLVGRDRIARFFIGAAKNADRYQGHQQPGVWSHATCQLNGNLGLLLYFNGQLEQTLTIDVTNGHIAAIYVMRNREKLAGLMS